MTSESPPTPLQPASVSYITLSWNELTFGGQDAVVCAMTPCRYESGNVHVFTCHKSVCRMWVERQFHGLPSTEPSLPAFLLAAYNKSFSFPRIPNEFSIKKFLVNHHYQHYLSLVPSPPFHFLFLGSSSQAQCELWPLSVSFRDVIFSRTFSVPFFRCVDFLEQHRTKDFHL